MKQNKINNHNKKYHQTYFKMLTRDLLENCNLGLRVMRNLNYTIQKIEEFRISQSNQNKIN